MKRLTSLASLLLLVCSCATVRSATRDLQNVDRVGERAPPLEGGTWVVPAELDEGDVERAEWKLLVVFRPD